MSEVVELEPCPFCGGPAEIWRATPGTTRKAWIACVGRCVVISKEHETDAEAVAAWNRRSLTGEGEPVAWRWREPDSTLWAATAQRHTADSLAADPNFEVQPLYTRPVACPDREAVISALLDLGLRNDPGCLSGIPGKEHFVLMPEAAERIADAILALSASGGGE